MIDLTDWMIDLLNGAKRECMILFSPSVGPSVGRSLRRSVPPFFFAFLSIYSDLWSCVHATYGDRPCCSLCEKGAPVIHRDDETRAL